MAIPAGRVGGAAAADPRPTRGRSVRRALAGGATAAVLLGLLTPGTALAESGPTPGPDLRVGKAPAAPKDAVPAEAPADSTPLSLSITLDPRDPGALKNFVAAVSNPDSPQYRHYLKTGEFAQLFGADKATLDAVTRTLTEAGLHPGAPDPNGLTIPVSTTVGEARKAFDTDFSGYRLADGSTAYANTEAPKLSGRIAGQVAGVVGLNNLVKPHADHTAAKKPAVHPNGTATGKAAPLHNTGQPALCPDVRSFLSSFGAEESRDYFTGTSLANVYQKSFVNGGAGSTIALYELEDYNDAAIASYQSCFGTSTPVSRVKVNGGPTEQPTASNGVGVETALDIETVIGLVPNAEVLVYQGPDAARATTEDELAVYRRIVADNRAQVLSISWGRCELRADPAYMQSENLIFQQAAAQGQTVVAASGDSGSTGCNYGGVADNRLAVDDPASQPYVTGVGGTTVTVNASPQEKVWNSGGGGGGGGVSQRWSLDSATGYQAGLSGQGYSDACKAAAGQACRQVPDVSALADSTRGYLVANYADGDGTYWNSIGGTSGAAPLWAAVVAHANSDAQCASGGPVGFLNPLLYKLKGGSLTDVTTGTNNVPGAGNASGLYAATAGYDLATGLGTPKVDTLTRELCAALPQSPAGTFQSLTPKRLLDTREGNHPLGAYGEQVLQIAGNGGIPASGVTSVVLNVTVTAPTTDGHLTVYPSGGARPTTSNLNWTAGRTVPNLVTVPVGQDGKVRFYNGAWGGIHLIADVQGYYTSATDGAKYQASGPTRVLDTRTAAPLAAYGEQVLTSAELGAPAGTKAVVLNVTSTDSKSDGHLTVYPSGGAAPTTSNLNWTAGQTVPNQVIVPLGADGSVKLYNGSWGSTQVIADVFGFLGTGDGASFHSATPHRLMDSRLGLGTFQGSFGGREVRALNLDFGGRLSGAKAVVLNVTVTNPQGDGHLLLYPNGQNAPTTSNLNWTAGQTVANMVTVPVGQGGVVEILNGSWSNADVIVDVFGYYS
ncbi:S53 family peptidase [Kitasatospora sp. NPDC049258]|uniref:S53 family peptidase n=1 Tax=Kitasatospora sp. NPDC049258 TaxID=3155394 RepID=UPI0034362E2F